ncbi:MAG: hypothetical protein AAB638_02940, partial [Patescibacteria group bacterium]
MTARRGKRNILLRVLSTTIIGIFVFLNISSVGAAVPHILSFQGRLTNASGDLLGDSGTNYYFKFSIYNASSGGTELWTSSASGITIKVTQGVFNTLLGDTTAGFNAINLDFDSSSPYYLEIQVSSNNTDFEVLTPRQRIVSSGFAVNADTVHGGRFLNATGVGQFGGLATVSYSRFGTAATSHGLSGASDVLINGMFETDGQAFFDSSASVSLNFELGGTASISGNINFGGAGAHTIGALAGSGALTINAFTLGGAITGNSNSITDIGQFAATNASISNNFEVSANASVSSLFGSAFTGISNCNSESQTLNWNSTTGKFSCLNDASGSGGGATPVTIQTFPGGTRLQGRSSISFDFATFTVTASGAADARIGLNYLTGPASRSMAQTISGLWTFTGGATFSAPFELSSTASIGGNITTKGTLTSSNTGSSSFSGSLNLSKSLTSSTSVTAASLVSTGALSVAGNTVLIGTFTGSSTSSNSFAGSLNLSKSLTATNSVTAGSFATGGGLSANSITASTINAFTLGGSITGGNFDITGLTLLTSTNASHSNNLEVGSTASIGGNATIKGTLGVTGITTLGTANITTATLSGALSGTTASFSTNFEIVGYASASNYQGGTIALTGTGSNSFAGSFTLSKGLTANSYQGGGLSICSSSGNVLRFASGQFSCATLADADIPDNITITGYLDSDIPLITIGNTSSSSFERALAGTANQITLTDGGANGAATLSIPSVFSITTASLSSNFEAVGYASIGGNLFVRSTGSSSYAGSLNISKGLTANSFQGGGLGTCTGSANGIQYSGGQFSCGSITGTASSGADTDIPFITFGNTASLAFERSLAGTANQITLTDGGANGAATLSIPSVFSITTASLSSNFEAVGYASIGGNITTKGTLTSSNT